MPRPVVPTFLEPRKRSVTRSMVEWYDAMTCALALTTSRDTSTPRSSSASSTTIAGIRPPPAPGSEPAPTAPAAPGRASCGRDPTPRGPGSRRPWARVPPVDPLLVITNDDAGTADEEALRSALAILRRQCSV